MTLGLCSPLGGLGVMSFARFGFLPRVVKHEETQVHLLSNVVCVSKHAAADATGLKEHGFGFRVAPDVSQTRTVPAEYECSAREVFGMGDACAAKGAVEIGDRFFVSLTASE